MGCWKGRTSEYTWGVDRPEKKEGPEDGMALKFKPYTFAGIQKRKKWWRGWEKGGSGVGGGWKEDQPREGKAADQNVPIGRRASHLSNPKGARKALNRWMGVGLSVSTREERSNGGVAGR